MIALAPRVRYAQTARERGEPWAGVLAAADRKIVAYKRLIKEWAAQGRDALDMPALEKAIAEGREADAAFVVGSALSIASSLLSARVPPLVLETLAAGAEAAASNARREDRIRFAARGRFSGFRLDLTNPLAVRWAQTRAGELITGLTASTRDAVLSAVRSIIAESHLQGIPVSGVARLLRQHIGLTEVQARAVTNLRARMLASPGGKVWAGDVALRMPKAGASWDLLVRRGEEYASRLLNLRTLAVARTETIAASNEGQRQLWLQARDQGLLRGDEGKQWIVTPDDRLCPICEGLNGETVGLEESFSVGVQGPPAHALCRCTFGLARGPVRSRVPVPTSPLAGFNPTAYNQIGDLVQDLRGRLGIDPSVVIDLQSSAAARAGAHGFYDPATRFIGLERGVAQGLVETMFGERTPSSWNAVRSLAHESMHARSAVMQALARGERLPDWYMYWEEAVAEHRARAAATELMFRSGGVPDWVMGASRSYVDEVARLRFLEQRGLDIERFYGASARERLTMVNEIARREAATVLTEKFSHEEIQTIINRLGDDAQHLVRLNRVSRGNWGTMTRRQILRELRQDWGIVL